MSVAWGMELFSYKNTRDFGFAPNPFFGVCTLATCKPGIRRSANVGDLVACCGSTNNKLAGRVICIMKVSGALSFQEYWDDPRFVAKKPHNNGSKQKAYGDNIYHKCIDDHWIQSWSHHSSEDGTLNEANLVTDTGADRVLWSNDFIYWGGEALLIPPMLRAFQDDDLYPEKIRDYRRKFAQPFIDKVDEWFHSIPFRGLQGRPGAW